MQNETVFICPCCGSELTETDSVEIAESMSVFSCSNCGIVIEARGIVPERQKELDYYKNGQKRCCDEARVDRCIRCGHEIRVVGNVDNGAECEEDFMTGVVMSQCENCGMEETIWEHIDNE